MSERQRENESERERREKREERSRQRIYVEDDGFMGWLRERGCLIHRWIRFSGYGLQSQPLDLLLRDMHNTIMLPFPLSLQDPPPPLALFLIFFLSLFFFVFFVFTLFVNV